MSCWRGHLHGARHKLFTYRPADVIATPAFRASLNQEWFYLSSFWCWLKEKYSSQTHLTAYPSCGGKTYKWCYASYINHRQFLLHKQKRNKFT